MKELRNRELGHPREGEGGGIGRAGCRAGSNVSTHSRAPNDHVGTAKLM
jgi:hypothetical protein